MNLHEIRNKVLLDYTSDFQLNGSMIIGPIEHKTNIRFKNVDVLESHKNAIDIDYDSEDVTFTGYVNKTFTPRFKKENRFQYGRGTDFKKVFVKQIGNNCYTPTSGNCFSKCINYSTEKNYTEEFSTFIRTEKYRSAIMTSASFQPFCRKYSINIGCFDGTRINPRNITERNTSLFIENIHFCLIRKS